MDPLVVTAGTSSADELLTALERGQRVVVQSRAPREDREATLEWDGRAFHCDTPTRRHAHESREEMRACIEREGYVSDSVGPVME